MPMQPVNISDTGYQMFLDDESVFAPQLRGQERRAQQNALARQQAVRNALAQSINPQTGVTNYEFARQIGGVDLAPELQAAQQADMMAQAELASKKATAAKAMSDADKQFMELTYGQLATLVGRPDAEAAPAYAAIRQDITSSRPHLARFMPETYSQGGLKQSLRTAEMVYPKLEMADLGTTKQPYDPYTGEPVGTGMAVSLSPNEQSMEADREEQRKISRGQLGVAQGNLKVAQDRLAFDQSKQGAGATELAPKDRQKRDAAFPQASAALRSSVQEIDTLKADLLALKAHPGLAGITGGIEGRLPSVKGSSSAAQAKLDKIIARGQFRELQNLRNSSPTGAAVGNVSDKEGQALRASFAALDQRQDLSDFQAAIDDAVSQLDFAKGTISQAYDDTYSYRQGAAPASAPAANANTVTTPDGKVLTFPSAEAAAAFKKAAGLQ